MTLTTFVLRRFSIRCMKNDPFIIAGSKDVNAEMHICYSGLKVLAHHACFYTSIPLLSVVTTVGLKVFILFTDIFFFEELPHG